MNDQHQLGAQAFATIAWAPGERAHIGARAEALLSERMRRSDYLPDDLFGEPAWNILLIVYAATLKNEIPCIKHVCLAADQPMTTILRWMSVLEAEGLLVRRRRLVDARAVEVMLSARCIGLMTAYLRSLSA